MSKQLLQQQLVDACYYGELAQVTSALRRGAAPNSPDGRGYFPLHFACQEGHLDVVNALIKWGADVNIPDHEGSLPLFSAVGGKHPAIIRRLLAHGADVNARRRPPSDDTPLLLACAFDDLRVVSLLVKAGGDIELADRRGRTPIFFATMYGHREIVNFLIRKGANLKRKCRNGRTVLEIAHKNKDTKIAGILERAQQT
jgi:ankyrin repeat protein